MSFENPSYAALLEASCDTLPQPLAERPPDLIDLPFRIEELKPGYKLSLMEWFAIYNPYLMPLAVAAGADVNAPRAPLVAAVETGLCDLVRTLIDLGADTNCISDGCGKARTPLIAALKRNDRSMVDLLLQLGADPNLARLGHYRPLYRALRCEDISFANVLLSYGADWRMIHPGRIVSLPLDKFRWFVECSGYCPNTIVSEGRSLLELTRRNLPFACDAEAKIALLVARKQKL